MLSSRHTQRETAIYEAHTQSKMSKFTEHMGLITQWLPAFDGLTGFFFYSFMVYLMVLFFGWLLNPTVDKIIADDIK